MESTTKKRGLRGLFRDMQLWKKILLAYVLVILVPSAFFIGSYLVQTQRGLYDEYRLNDQRSLQQSYSNFKARMKLLESYSVLFQNNKVVTDYLQGYFYSVSQEMHAYLEDVWPLISFVYAANTDVQAITLYTYRKPLVPLSENVIYLDAPADEIAAMPLHGQWHVLDQDSGILLDFQKPIYTFQYRRKEAYLSVQVPLLPLLSQFMPDTENSCLFLSLGDAYYAYQGGQLLPADAPTDGALTDALLRLENAQSLADPQLSPYLVSDVHLEEIDGTMFVLTAKGEIVDRGSLLRIGVLLGTLFVLLSVFYYLIVASVVRRLTRFGAHLRKVDFYALDEYAEPAAGSDEVGLLIQTHNAMITRIRTLVDDLNLAELRKKEAAFHALQAQIKPHFIFNSLETIRMMAECNEDVEVADALYNLGNFIRYSMKESPSGVTLSTEIANVDNYLLLCKARMQNRLTYDIEPDASAGNLSCPSFILQPLVENSIHHAAKDPYTPLHIVIQVRAEGAFVHIHISDDGIGIPPEKLSALRDVLEGKAQHYPFETKGNGIGIHNVSERIAEYFHGAAQFSITSQPGHGTTCHITLPTGGNTSW